MCLIAIVAETLRNSQYVIKVIILKVYKYCLGNLALRTFKHQVGESEVVT